MGKGDSVQRPGESRLDVFGSVLGVAVMALLVLGLVGLVFFTPTIPLVPEADPVDAAAEWCEGFAAAATAFITDSIEDLPSQAQFEARVQDCIANGYADMPLPHSGPEGFGGSANLTR